jgi:hypothetical protein
MPERMVRTNMHAAPLWLTNSFSVHFHTLRGYAIGRSPLMHEIYHIIIFHFLFIWLFFLVLVIACGYLVSNRDSRISPIKQTPSDLTEKPPRRLTLVDTASALAFLLFLIGYAFLIFYKEDFAYYDDDVLTDFSLRGRAFAPVVWPDLGRFFPLAEQEFNLLGFITRTPFGYHSLVVIQLVILLAILYVILHKLQIRYRVLVLAAAMTAPSFLIPFAGFVYPERNVLFWLVTMLFCLQGYSKTRSPLYFIGCLVATHFALYYKETVVLFVVTYVVTRLLLELHFMQRGSHRSWRDFASENALSLGMLGVSAIFVLFFSIVMLPHRTFSYVSGLREPLSSVLLAYLQIDWLPMILLAVLLVRLGLFFFSDGDLDPLWDPLAAGALAYFFVVVSLRINSGYFMAPADLFALLYLANLASVWISRPAKIRMAVLASVVVFVLLQNCAYSSFRMVERKSLITTKSQLAEFLKGYLPTVQSGRVELFFPYANNFHLMGLSSYLRYKGFLLEGQGVTGENPIPRLVFTGREKFSDNRCVNYRDYTCIHAESPGSGALIVVLPDDNVSMSDVQRVREDSDLVFFVQSCAACTKLDSWFRSLHAISPEFSVKKLPEHWLQLDVYKRHRD